MNKRKLQQLRRRLRDLRRRGGIKSAKAEALAKAVGRVRHKRGSEPTWINRDFSQLRPLSIPRHSKDLNRFTAASILDQLEEDLDWIEQNLKSFGDEEDISNE